MSTSPPRAPVTLATDLRHRDDTALSALLRARPDLLSPVPSDVTSLAARATTRASLQRALDDLDLATLQVLEALCVLPEPVARPAVGRAVGDPDDVGGTTSAAVDLLVDRALVFRDEDGGLYVPRAVRDVVGSPAGLGPPVERLLQVCGPRRLETLARDLGGSPSDVLTDPDRVAELVAAAPPAARDALEALVWGPPAGRLPDATRAVSVETASTPVEWLLARGLLLAADDRTVVLPREVALALRGGLVHRQPAPRIPPHDLTPVDRERVDGAAAGAAATVVRQVDELLELWQDAPPRMLRAGGIGVRDRNRTAAALDVPDATLTLLVEVAYAAGLLSSGDDRQTLEEVWLPTPAYDSWREKTVAARWVALATAWLDATRVIGLVGGADSRGRALAPLGPDLERTSAPPLRRAVLEDLASVAADQATTPESLLARLQWRAPRRGGLLRQSLVTWTLEEGQALGVVSGPALSTAARRLVQGDPRAAEAELAAVLPPLLDHVLLQADLTAVAPGPLEPDLARQLRLLATVESTGGATVYRFTESSVRQAFDEGWTAADVLALLQQRSRTPVPQPLRYLVEDVARRHGRLRVSGVSCVLRSDDEAVLAELLADRRAGGLRLRRLAPTVLGAGSGPDLVLDRLRDLGYAPAPEAADGSVVVARPQPRRAPQRRPAAPVRTGPPEPGPELLAAAVSALRAGERAVGVPLSRPAADVLAVLTDAAANGEALWIGYVDAEGRGSQRLIEPVAVEAGQVSAYDHLRAAMRTFAVHRITGVSPATEGQE